MVLPKTGFMPEMELEWKIPQWSNAIERQRARSYHQAYSALVGLYNLEQALKEVRAGRTKSWNDFKVPESAVSVGFHEAARGVLSHHMVIRDGKIANYQPYPPTPWNGNPRDVARDARARTRTRCRTRRSSRRTARELQGRRHHAGGPQLRPVPALRGAHVREGQGPQGRPHADGDVLNSEQLIARVQELTAQLEEVQDFQARAVADELVASIIQLYGEGLERIFAALDGPAPDGAATGSSTTASSPACC